MKNRKTRRIKREKERELKKCNEFVDYCLSEFFEILFEEKHKHLSYSEVFDMINSHYVSYSNWLNKYRLKHISIDTMFMQNNLNKDLVK